MNPTGLEKLRRWIDDQWDQVLDSYEEAATRERQENRDNLASHPTGRQDPGGSHRPAAGLRALHRAGRRMVAADHPFDRPRRRGRHPLRDRRRRRGLRVDRRRGRAHLGRGHRMGSPHRFVLNWHPRINPTAASTLEVSFSPEDGGHPGHPRAPRMGTFRCRGRGADAESYEQGWDVVLSGLETFAGTARFVQNIAPRRPRRSTNI